MTFIEELRHVRPTSSTRILVTDIADGVIRDVPATPFLLLFEHGQLVDTIRGADRNHLHRWLSR
jgi:hypothetical protein